MTLATYSPESVVCLLGGVIPVDGFSNNTFITIKKSTPIFETVVSADGVVSRTQIDNPLYSVSISLASTAQTNEVLTALSYIDKKTGRGKLPLLIKDNSGTSLFYATQAWVEGTPDMEFNLDVGVRTWVFSCIGVSEIVGGNQSLFEIPTPLISLGSRLIDELLG
jgi:Protein of unknown function (DUF3277)